MKAEILNKPKSPALQQGVVSSSADFEDAVALFQLYKPVKIARPLRDEFHNFISKHFMNIGVEKWSATIYPQVKSYKFQRT
jgi:hypothetical protein